MMKKRRIERLFARGGGEDLSDNLIMPRRLFCMHKQAGEAKRDHVPAAICKQVKIHYYS